MDEDTKPLVDVGDVIEGRYRVDRVLGQGAMGMVVAATHLELHQSRAIKFMLPEMMHDRDGVERFLREARAAARLQSQHAVKVHDVARLPTGEPYIVMEHLEGTDLKRHLHNRRTLPVAEAATYIVQACDAIAEAHAAGIVHRDLKPANMFLVHHAGSPPCLKVLDFGIAKLNDAKAKPSDGPLTSTHMVIGSPPYMSPEQIISTRDVDGRTDIWSLGVILYSMVTGRMPFRGESAQVVFAAVQRDAPVRPSDFNPDLPPAFEQIILRCLEKEPARRYASASELAAALAPFTQADPAFADTMASETNAATQLWRRSSPQHAQNAGAPSYPELGSHGTQPMAPNQPRPMTPSYPQAPQGHPQAPQSYPQASPSYPYAVAQSYPQASPSYPRPLAPSYSQLGVPPASPSGTGSDSMPQPWSQSASQPAAPSYPQPGAQAYPPMAQPTAATAPRRGLSLLLVGGLGAAIASVTLMLIFSRANANPSATPAALQATAAEATSLPPVPAATPTASATSTAAVVMVSATSGATDTPVPSAREAGSRAKPPPSPSPSPSPSTQVIKATSTPSQAPAPAPPPASSATSKPAAMSPSVPSTGAPLKRRQD